MGKYTLTTLQALCYLSVCTWRHRFTHPELFWVKWKYPERFAVLSYEEVGEGSLGAVLALQIECAPVVFP